MAFATGRHMARPAARPRLHAGPRRGAGAPGLRRAGRLPRRRRQLAPGLSLHLLGRPHRRAPRWCGCGRPAAGWCWPPTPATTTRTWRRDGRSPSSTTSAPCSTGYDRLRRAGLRSVRHRPRARPARAGALPGRRSGARGHRGPPRRGPRRRLIRLPRPPRPFMARTSGATGRHRGRERSSSGQPGVGVRGSARSSRAIRR